jgi:hypothetical protein
MTNEAGLQFSGEPSDRALRATKLLNNSDIRQVVEANPYGESRLIFATLRTNDIHTILEALELMAGEKK